MVGQLTGRQELKIELLRLMRWVAMNYIEHTPHSVWGTVFLGYGDHQSRKRMVSGMELAARGQVLACHP